MSLKDLPSYLETEFELQIPKNSAVYVKPFLMLMRRFLKTSLSLLYDWSDQKHSFN